MIDSNLLLVSDELNSSIDFSSLYEEKSNVSKEDVNETIVDIESVNLIRIKTNKNKFKFYFKITDANLFIDAMDMFVNKYNSFRFLFGGQRYILKGVNKTNINLNKNKMSIEVKNVKITKE